MKFSQDQEEHAKAAVRRLLEKFPIEADEDPMIEYIMTLLTHDKSKDELKEYSLSNLSDFFEQQAPAFVDELFAGLDKVMEGEWQSSARPEEPQRLEVPVYRYSRRSSDDEEDEDDDKDERHRRHQRERDREDCDKDESRFSRGGRDAPPARDFRGRERDWNQGMRERDRGEVTEQRPFSSASSSAHPSFDRKRQLPYPSGGSGDFGARDPKRRREDFEIVPQMMFPNPVVLPLPYEMAQMRPPPPPQVTIQRLNPKHFNNFSQFEVPLGPPTDVAEYDPAAPAITAPLQIRPPASSFPQPMHHAQGIRAPRASEENYQVPMTTEAPQREPFAGERRTDFRPRQPHDRPRPSHRSPIIQVDKIPAEHLAIDQLNEHFKKFGLIVNIQLVPHERRALVEFSSTHEALQAVKSAEPIFGNRFIVVKFQGEDRGFQPKAPHQTREEAEAEKKEKAAAEAAAQAVLLEQKRREILANKLELKKRKESLLEKLTEEQKSIFEKLKSPELAEEERKELLKRVSTISTQMVQIKTVGPAKAQKGPMSLVANKPAEAATSTTEKPVAAVGGFQPRPPGSATMRPFTPGFPGGRGAAFAARGGRGGFAGRGGRAPAVTSMHVDNRPTRFLVKNVPPELAVEEELRAHFKPFGEILEITFQENGAVVRFETRAIAEAAFMKGNKIHNAPLSFLWLPNPPATAQAKTETQPSEQETEASTEEITADLVIPE